MIRNWNVAFASTIALIIMANSAQADEQSMPSQIKPAPELEQLQYFQGKWTCVIKESAASPSAAGVQFTWTVKRTLNNFWFLGQAEDTKNVAITHDTLGYNPVIKKFGRTVLTDDGQFINLLSEGWKGQTMIWEGSLVRLVKDGQRDMLRETIVKRSNREFDAAYEIMNPTKKQWRPLVQETCKKSN